MSRTYHSINILRFNNQNRIIDFGIGIPEDEIKLLFTSFYRATNTSTIIGSGLGLTIVKQFTEQLKGNIKLESKENSKTNFTLCFPYE
ncbi:sensor histidine kinase [Flavobacterium nitratireducens]|uniref:sensor histidine kinase n=1 Tax=Flavobacterium nitratireducens TaxID=992289 RepID=UPI003BF5AD13